MNLPPAIIVDIDGTVALRNPNGRDPYDGERVGEDAPNSDVILLVECLHDSGFEVIFMSAREDTGNCRRLTEEWLNRNVAVLWRALLLRPEGDRRPDEIVKLELFEDHVQGEYEVAAIFEDRQKVVDMWRDLGFTCLQVAPGDF